MTEQFGFDQVARDRRHVDGDERAAAPFAVIVQCPRDQLLAGAGFPRDHHGEIGLHQPGEHAVDFLHRGRAADQRDRVELFGFLDRTRPLLGLRQRSPHDADELLEIERLRQIFISAALGRPHRGHERVLRAHDDDGKLRAQLLDARQKIERVLVGHHDVGDDEIAVTLADPAPERGGVAGRAHFIAGARQGLVEDGADRGVVVGQQDTSSRHGHFLFR